MGKKRKKTKAQIAYEKKRKVIAQYKRRHGTDIELPLTPTQMFGRGNVTAKQYREFTAELNRFNKALKEYTQIEERNKKKQKIDDEILPFAEATIENYKDSLRHTSRTGYTRNMIAWIDGLVRKYGVTKVADMIVDAQSNGITFTWRTLNYENDYFEYISDMLRYLDDNDMEREALDEIMKYTEESEPFFIDEEENY